MKRENANTIHQLLKSVFKSSKGTRLNERRFWRVYQNLPENLTPRDIDEGITINAWQNASRESQREQVRNRKIRLGAGIMLVVAVLAFLGVTYVPEFYDTYKENQAQTQTEQAVLSQAPTLTATSTITATTVPTDTPEPTPTLAPTETLMPTATPIPEYYFDSIEALPETLQSKFGIHYIIPGSAFNPSHQQPTQEVVAEENQPEEDEISDIVDYQFLFEFTQPLETGFYQVYARNLLGAGTVDVGSGLVHRGGFDFPVEPEIDDSSEVEEGTGASEEAGSVQPTDWEYIGTYFVPENEIGNHVIDLVVNLDSMGQAEILLGKVIGPQAEILGQIDEKFASEISNNTTDNPQFVLLDFIEDADQLKMIPVDPAQQIINIDQPSALFGKSLRYEFSFGDGWIDIDKGIFKDSNEPKFTYDIYLFDQSYANSELKWAKQQDSFRWFSIGNSTPDSLGDSSAEEITPEGNFIRIIEGLTQDEIANINETAIGPESLRLINFKIISLDNNNDVASVNIDFLIIVKR